MEKPLRILIVEDSEDDSRLLIREIRKSGYEVDYQRVETYTEMQTALEDGEWDLILCDYSLPQFGAPQALELLKTVGRDLPFIIISGTIGEETAVAALKAGANDFLIKGKYARLGPAIERELRDAETRHHHRRAEEALQESQKQLLSMIESAPISIAMFDRNMVYIVASRRWIEEYGRGHDELIGLNHYDVHPDIPERWKEAHHRGIAGESLRNDDDLWIQADGAKYWLRWAIVPWHDSDGEIGGIIISAEDITQRKQAEETLQKRDEELQLRNVELTRLYRASEPLLSGVLDDLTSLAQTIVQTVLREFEHSNCSLFLLNTESHELERLAVAGPYTDQVSKAQLSLDRPGLVAKAMRAGHMINASDVMHEADYVPNWDAARSELVIPLKVGNETIGALDVQSPDPGAFQEEDERLMSIFSGRAALSLERSRLHEQTLRQLERLEALRTIDLAISNTLDLRVSMSVVLEQVINQLGVDAACVLLVKPEHGRLEYAMGRGFRTRGIESSNLRPGEGLAGQAARERRIVSSENLATEPHFTRRNLLANENFVSYFGIPLISRGEVKGVLEVFRRTPLKPNMEWLSFLDSLGWQTAIAVDNALLLQSMQRSNVNLVMAYEATIEGWSRALDLRDKETEGHTLRVTEMTIDLASAINIGGDQIAYIRRGALLHDIGKMGVPDHILLKAGPLTDSEWEIMRQHPQFAFDLLSPIEYLKESLDIPYCHHEKWDGTGYPRGLSGTQIPLAARLFAVVDVWDAITSDRPYRKKWSKEKALDFIREQSGTHFDPAVVEVFLREAIGLKSSE